MYSCEQRAKGTNLYVSWRPPPRSNTSMPASGSLTKSEQKVKL